jgi:hypothetical protein
VVYQYEWHGAQVKPGVIDISPTGQVLLRINSWKSWGSTDATRSGSELIDNCIPDCANGKYVKHPASAVLFRLRDHNGHAYFTRMRIRALGTTSTIKFGPEGWIY